MIYDLLMAEQVQELQAATSLPLDQILTAAQYATNVINDNGKAEPDLPDSHEQLSSTTFYPLQLVVTDVSVPRHDRFAAAMCQFLLAPVTTEEQLKELLLLPQVARLFRMGMCRLPPKPEWGHRYGIVCEDCMWTFERWLS